MKFEEVCRLSLAERFVYWIKERHQIYLRRRHYPPPWSDDKVFRTTKFCNVRRHLDRTSQYLINNWYEPHRDHPNMVPAVVLARQLNLIDTLEAVGFPLSWDSDLIYRILEDRDVRGVQNFGKAYVVTGNLGCRNRPKQKKYYQTVYVVCKAVLDKPPTIHPHSMQKTWSGMLDYPGLSFFIAGQVVADLRWAVSGSWEDKNDWAPAGPGSIRALCRLDGLEVKKTMKQREFIQRFTRWKDKVQSFHGIPSMEAIDFQNCLCEWDKYERVIEEPHRYRRKYPPPRKKT